MALYRTSVAFLGQRFMQRWGKYVCIPCEYVYDPEVGDPENEIPPGTRFEDLPDDWQCPVCFVDKDEFEKVEA